MSSLLEKAKQYLLAHEYILRNNKQVPEVYLVRLQTLARRLNTNNFNVARQRALDILAENRKSKRSMNSAFVGLYNAVHNPILNEKFKTQYTHVLRNMARGTDVHEHKKSILARRNSLLRHAQRRMRKPTNYQIIKAYNANGNYSLHRNVTSDTKERRGYNLANNFIRNRHEKLYSDPTTVPAVTTIQRYFRGYKNRRISPRIQFLKDMAKYRDMEYYVNTLARLEFGYRKVLQQISLGANALDSITKIIGTCHYKKNPHKRVQNVQNVRKNMLLLKKKTPREYLQSLRKQFHYVSHEYSKMTLAQKKEYIERLRLELSGRPCLENLLDSLVHVVSEPDLVWLGKGTNVLNNNRYLSTTRNNGLMKKAIMSWSISKNRPRGWNAMNTNQRKQYFWNKVKNKSVYMTNGSQVFNAPISRYNTNGAKFKQSNVANWLEYTS